MPRVKRPIAWEKLVEGKNIRYRNPATGDTISRRQFIKATSGLSPEQKAIASKAHEAQIAEALQKTRGIPKAEATRRARKFVAARSENGRIKAVGGDVRDRNLVDAFAAAMETKKADKHKLSKGQKQLLARFGEWDELEDGPIIEFWE